MEQPVDRYGILIQKGHMVRCWVGDKPSSRTTIVQGWNLNGPLGAPVVDVDPPVRGHGFDHAVGSWNAKYIEVLPCRFSWEVVEVGADRFSEEA